MSKELSPTMKAARTLALANGGKLKRFPGGFWCLPNITGQPEHNEYHGTPTMQALVKRGAAHYSEWKERRHGGRFPVEITMVPDANTP